MWTISDFPTYGILSGWSTTSACRLACPYCMENTKSFMLKHGRKQTWLNWSMLGQELATRRSSSDVIGLAQNEVK